jgi:hypothetical protein
MKTSNKKINKKLQTKLALWQIDQIPADSTTVSAHHIKIPGWKAAPQHSPTAGSTKLRRWCTVSTSRRLITKAKRKKESTRVFCCSSLYPSGFLPPPPIRITVSPLPAMNATRMRRARRPSREDGDEGDQRRRREVDDDRARLAPGAGAARRRRARGALPARGTCNTYNT